MRQWQTGSTYNKRHVDKLNTVAKDVEEGNPQR
jgi:hypothetical protein